RRRRRAHPLARARAARPHHGIWPARDGQRGSEAFLSRHGHALPAAHRRALRRRRNRQAVVNAQHAEDYLAALKHQRRLASATLANYRRALGLLLELHKQPPATPEPAQVRRAVALLHAKGLSPRTLALILSAWRGWFRWLARHRGFRANPVLGIRAPKAGRPLPKALTVEATQRLLDSTDEKSAA